MKTAHGYIALVAFLTIASGAQAQNVAHPDSSAGAGDRTVVATHAATQSLIDAPSAMRRNVDPTPAPAAAIAQNHAGLGQSKAMMIVGGAALITGAIVGGKPGTIIMVGGAVVGLYGLYQYLQ